LAIFVSGTGTNAAKIIDYFSQHKLVLVDLIVVNKPNAGVLSVAKTHHIDTWLIERSAFYETDCYLNDLKTRGIDFLILAGFLWKVPEYLVSAFPNKIVNIHPALLPKFGGKGMYGMKVHEAVVDAGEKETGITIHYVNEQYDEGAIIFQSSCTVEPTDTPEIVAQKVHELEHRHFAEVLEGIVIGRQSFS
ncbi:MAG: phosphoribosylglycinamide formyltransferase, partial [Sphingobacteriia bacterium]